MSRSRTSRAARAFLFPVALSLTLPALGEAQGGPGFLFKQPTVTVRFETGYGIQSAGSEIFDFVRDTFEVGARDFDGPYFGGEIAYRATERFDLALGVGVVQASVETQFREWYGTDGLPIEQVMELRIVPITLSGRYHFADRGRTVGRFAWVPNRVTPYVGGGVGLISHRFELFGEFVDYQTLEIFYDEYVSEGTSGLLRGLAGVTVSLGRQFELSGEARYTLSSAEMSRDFDGFDRMDLKGFQGVVGIAVRF